MPTETIPVVDLQDWAADGPKRSAFVQTLGRGLEDYGFVAVLGHGFPKDHLDRSYATARELFSLPEHVKRRHETPDNGRQRGYTSRGVEKALDSSQPDIKEFWHFGRELPDDHPLTVSGEVPPNEFPAELPHAREVFLDHFNRVEAFANELLDGVGAYLEIEPGHFRRMVHEGNSILRVIHYPDDPTAQPGAVRAAAHEDINLLTVLPASTRPGLQLLTRHGEWLPIITPPDVMICDTGDMMQWFTGGRLPATTHRVVNPEQADGGRLSMPFFLHPHPDAVLTPADGETPAVTARDRLHERLRAIGVM